MRFLSLLVLFFSLSAWSYEEVFIQTVSKENKTFVTRHGRDKGIIVGHQATFLAENVAIVAKAKIVTREFTLWELDNAYATVPFEKGQIVTYQDAKEYAWTLMPIETQMKLKRIYLKDPQWSGTLFGGYSRGLSESTSGVNSTAIATSRSGFVMETHADYDVTPTLELGAGLRFENEVITTSEVNLLARRYMVLANIKYLFPVITSFYNSQVYGGLSFGAGKSSTASADFSQSGTTTLLPSMRLGLKLPVTDDYWCLFEASVDNISSKETLPESGDTQTTNQSVGKFMVGLKRYF